MNEIEKFLENVKKALQEVPEDAKFQDIKFVASYYDYPNRTAKNIRINF